MLKKPGKAPATMKASQARRLFFLSTFTLTNKTSSSPSTRSICDIDHANPPRSVCRLFGNISKFKTRVVTAVRQLTEPFSPMNDNRFAFEGNVIYIDHRFIIIRSEGSTWWSVVQTLWIWRIVPVAFFSERFPNLSDATCLVPWRICEFLLGFSKSSLSLHVFFNDKRRRPWNAFAAEGKCTENRSRWTSPLQCLSKCLNVFRLNLLVKNQFHHLLGEENEKGIIFMQMQKNLRYSENQANVWHHYQFW